MFNQTLHHWQERKTFWNHKLNYSVSLSPLAFSPPFPPSLLGSFPFPFLLPFGPRDTQDFMGTSFSFSLFSRVCPGLIVIQPALPVHPFSVWLSVTSAVLMHHLYLRVLNIPCQPVLWVCGHAPPQFHILLGLGPGSCTCGYLGRKSDTLSGNTHTHPIEWHDVSWSHDWNQEVINVCEMPGSLSVFCQPILHSWAGFTSHAGMGGHLGVWQFSY